MTAGEVPIVGLLLEDRESSDDVQAGVDHGRELPREHLQRTWLDGLLATLGLLRRRALVRRARPSEPLPIP
jgi:hypothetical protein